MRSFSICALLILFGISSYSQTMKINIAVNDLSAKNILQSDAEIISERLRSELHNTGVFKVMERNDMSSILKEQEFYNNDTSVTEKEKWGALYNWYAINTGKLAPAGWHVPTTADWDTLMNYLGGFTVAGGKLKEAGPVNWTSANTGATNESGFTALPGGNRNGNGVFDGKTNYGYWWSAQVIDLANARGIDLGSFYDYLGRFNCSKKFGFSVRLVKD